MAMLRWLAISITRGGQLTCTVNLHAFPLSNENLNKLTNDISFSYFPTTPRKMYFKNKDIRLRNSAKDEFSLFQRQILSIQRLTS